VIRLSPQQLLSCIYNVAWEVGDNPPTLSPLTRMRADFPDCSKSGSAGAICPDHLLLQSSRVKASKLTASFLAVVPIAFGDAAGEKPLACSQKERLARTLRLQKRPAGSRQGPGDMETLLDSRLLSAG